MGKSHKTLGGGNGDMTIEGVGVESNVEMDGMDKKMNCKT
jgi:hypothetical protein